MLEMQTYHQFVWHAMYYDEIITTVNRIISKLLRCYQWQETINHRLGGNMNGRTVIQPRGKWKRSWRQIPHFPFNMAAVKLFCQFTGF